MECASIICACYTKVKRDPLLGHLLSTVRNREPNTNQVASLHILVPLMTSSPQAARKTRHGWQTSRPMCKASSSGSRLQKYQVLHRAEDGEAPKGEGGNWRGGFSSTYFGKTRLACIVLRMTFSCTWHSRLARAQPRLDIFRACCMEVCRCKQSSCTVNFLPIRTRLRHAVAAAGTPRTERSRRL